mmetsp:Transcript_60884/g.170246  ORF Transcript_60884/g.170246 Transcript_60884/m.170246 type:complete len:226 (-) Transcript_60884:1143-1820(-)
MRLSRGRFRRKRRGLRGLGKDATQRRALRKRRRQSTLQTWVVQIAWAHAPLDADPRRRILSHRCFRQHRTGRIWRVQQWLRQVPADCVHYVQLAILSGRRYLILLVDILRKSLRRTGRHRGNLPHSVLDLLVVAEALEASGEECLLDDRDVHVQHDVDEVEDEHVEVRVSRNASDVPKVVECVMHHVAIQQREKRRVRGRHSCEDAGLPEVARAKEHEGCEDWND